MLQAVWFSASADLALDAERDFHDIGALRYDPVRTLPSAQPLCGMHICYQVQGLAGLSSDLQLQLRQYGNDCMHFWKLDSICTIASFGMARKFLIHGPIHAIQNVSSWQHSHADILKSQADWQHAWTQRTYCSREVCLPGVVMLQVRIHDLKRLNCKAGSSLVGLLRMECGILFSTYDMLISSGKETAATKAKAKAAAAAAAAARNGLEEGALPDLGHQLFGRSHQPDMLHIVCEAVQCAHAPMSESTYLVAGSLLLMHTMQRLQGRCSVCKWPAQVVTTSLICACLPWWVPEVHMQLMSLAWMYVGTLPRLLGC